MVSIRPWIAAAVVACVGCAPTEQLSDDPDLITSKSPVRVVATTGMVADLARHVGGSHVEVQQLLGAGTDPHLYKPNSDDVKSIVSADLVLYSGLMLEGKMADTLVKVARNRPVWAVTESIDPETLLEPDDASGHFDPHVWNDILTWSLCVDVVRQALAEVAPDHAADFQTNADAYRQELLAVHEYGLSALRSIPETRRILVTSHDAFNYFGRAYGLDVMGVQGLSTESEAGLQRINELVDLLVARDVRAVFVESSVPPKSIEALVEGAKSRNHEVVIGGELYSDAMGETGTYRGTYIGMMDHNITLVAKALGGSVPAGGLNGKLAE